MVGKKRKRCTFSGACSKVWLTAALILLAVEREHISQDFLWNTTLKPGRWQSGSMLRFGDADLRNENGVAVVQYLVGCAALLLWPAFQLVTCLGEEDYMGKWSAVSAQALG